MEISGGNFVSLDLTKNNGMLNLKKNDILDLTKAVPSLNKMRVAAGWDVNKSLFGGNYDLDLCAILVDADDKLIRNANACVYFREKESTGIYLDGDNLTGEGEGDDENIYVTLNEIPSNVEKIIFNVVIYDGISKRQKFSKVKNAYVRIVDCDKGDKEICRYDLSSDGGDNTAVVFAQLIKSNGSWNFMAIGDYKRASIGDLVNDYR